MCHFNKLFVKISGGKAIATVTLTQLTHDLQSLKSDYETYGAVKLTVSVVSNASVCELGPDQQSCSILEVDSQQHVCALEAGSYLSLIKASFVTTLHGFLTSVSGTTTCNDLFGEAQLKRGIFFSGIRYNYERMGISQVKVYERAGKSVT